MVPASANRRRMMAHDRACALSSHFLLAALALRTDIDASAAAESAAAATRASTQASGRADRAWRRRTARTTTTTTTSWCGYSAQCTAYSVQPIRAVRAASPPPPGLAGWLAARRDERADSTLLSRTSGRECVWTPTIELSSRPVCFRSPVRFVPFRPPCYASTRARPAVISSPVSRSRRGQEKRGMKSETVLARRKGTWPVRELNEQRVGRQVQPAMLTCHSRTSCDGQAPSDRT